MTKEQKVRLKERTKPIIFFGILGFAYYVWLLITDIKIPCVFYTVTGYLCPGCGTTRMAMALLRFDFVKAFSYNGAMFFVLPALGVVFLFETIRYVVLGIKKETVFSKIVLWGSGIGLLIFGILRNF